MRYTFNQRKRAVEMLQEQGLRHIERVVACFKCCIRTLWYWLALYSNGGENALQSKSSRPHSHPRQHTQEEHDKIVCLLLLFPCMSCIYILQELVYSLNYSRAYESLCRYIRTNNLRNEPVKPVKEKRINQPYHTPKMLGLKWQMDVKYVPTMCNIGDDKKYYQFTMIDECTRERFIYPYPEKSTYSCKDFIKRAIEHFGYIPIKIQTDNGTEFTNRLIATNPEQLQNLVDEYLNEMHVTHKLIRVATPRWNGKVENSHKQDQNNFYNSLRFKTYDELKEKMTEYLVRKNNTWTFAFGRKNPKSPNEKRAEKLSELDNWWFNEMKANKDVSLQQKIYCYAEYTRQLQIKQNDPPHTIIQIHPAIKVSQYVLNRILKII